MKKIPEEDDTHVMCVSALSGIFLAYYLSLFFCKRHVLTKKSPSYMAMKVIFNSIYYFMVFQISPP